MHLPLSQRLVCGYLTGDLSYVLFVKRFPKHGGDAAQLRAQQAYLAGNSGLNWFAWVGASVLGVLLSSLVPTSWGLGFAGILAVSSKQKGNVIPTCSLASSRLRVVAAGVAATAAVAAFALPLKLNILVAIAAAVAMCLVLEKTPLAYRSRS
jgi:predicted branched-subunit amino acid permease